MKFFPKETLSEEEIRSGLRTVIKDGLTSQAMVTLTMGVFLVAFALQLGASNAVVGLLAAIPFLAQLVQIPAIYLVEKVRNRKLISVYSLTVARLFWLLIGLIPFLFSVKVGLSALTIALLARSSLVAIGSTSWNSWMRDLVPKSQLGSFFSKRMSLATALGIPLSLVAAFYLDYWKKVFPASELYGYSILFFSGCLIGLVGIRYIAMIPEPRMVQTNEKTRFARLLLQPFKNENFKNLIIFLGSWNFAVNLAVPFFTVYMLKRLKLEMSVIITLSVISQIMSVAFFRVWGRFSDRFTNKSVLRVSGPLFIGCILAWTFTTMPERYSFTMPLLVTIHILTGISAAGVALASGNIGLKLAPRGQATAFLSTISLINSLAAGIGSILGGKFADFFAERELSWTMRWIGPGREFAFQTLNLQQWDFFFLLAFLIGLYSIHRLVLVKEVGEVKERVIIQELFSEIGRTTRNLSTIWGLRYVIRLPLSFTKKTFRRKK